MKQTDHNKTFTVADIQRYYGGDMSMQERHALEKAALDDPFLADALEGYQHTTTAQADVSELAQRLATKTAPAQKRVYPIFLQKQWMRVAALFLLLGGAGWTVYQFAFTTKEKLAVTQQRTTHTQDASTDSNASTQAVTDSTSAIQTEIETDQSALKKEAGSTTSATSTPSVANTARKPLPIADIPAANEVSAAPAPVTVASAPVKEKLSLRDADEAKDAGATSLTRSDATPLKTFKGQILDANGSPVPNASVMIKGKPNGTVTNTQGRFMLTTPDSILNATVAAIGFQSNHISLTNPAEEKTVILNESNAALNEVVVTGYGKKRMRSARPSAAQTKAEVEELEPEEGWTSYNNYINENLQIPEEVTTKQLKGEVELSFEVNKEGEPVNIKIEKSLCTSCDKEAIRLLQEGPSWKKKKRKSGKLKIRF
jgi:hypothetical protein